MSELGYMSAARSLVGLREIVGSQHEAKVVQFFAEAGHPGVKDDETPWCAAFANSMLARGGFKGTGSLMARSFTKWGEKADRPRVGDIVVFPRGDNPAQGHVGFVDSVDAGAGTIVCLGGNQSNAVTRQTRKIVDAIAFRRPSQAKTVVDVEAVQARLKALGYAPGVIDGDAGPDTMKAVNHFERNHGLSESKGELTAAVAAAILAVLPKPTVSVTPVEMKPIPTTTAPTKPTTSRKGTIIAVLAGLAAVAAGGITKFFGVW